MIAYVIRTPTLICDICGAHTRVTQPWYDNDTVAGDTFPDLRLHLEYLMVQVSPWGYFPDLTKRILVVLDNNSLQEEVYFCDKVLKVVTVSLYVSGFIGDDEVELPWLTKNVRVWKNFVEMMAVMEHRHQQTD